MSASTETERIANAGQAGAAGAGVGKTQRLGPEVLRRAQRHAQPGAESAGCQKNPTMPPNQCEAYTPCVG